ncbi:sensor histidine kinase [bacterium]|nr:sensor histidine kinase [bacterium]
MTKGVRIGIVAFFAIGVTVAHYVISPDASGTHELLQRVYYIPIVLAGLWFGCRWGLITAGLISIAYFPHALHGWHMPHTTLPFRILEMVMFHVIGGLTGFLSEREEAALDAEKEARAQEQSARLGREQAYERLRERTEELFTLEEQLRRSDRLAALGRLSAGFAHEIRNPLASIKTSVEILRDRWRHECQEAPEGASGEDDDPDFYEILIEETERLNKTVERFLEFARQEKNQSEDVRATCLVDEAIRKTRDLLIHEAEKRGIEIRLEFSEESVEVPYAEPHIRQVFLNLLLNAMDAVGKNGWIRVGLARKAEFAMVSVEDSGPGIRADMASRIFEPFFSTRDTGTGLGLSIVDRIISSKGGRIRLDQTSLPSSRFCLEFPYRAEEEDSFAREVGVG